MTALDPTQITIRRQERDLLIQMAKVVADMATRAGGTDGIFALRQAAGRLERTDQEGDDDACVSISNLLDGGWYRIHAAGERFWCHYNSPEPAPVTFAEAAKLYREGVRHGV